MLADILEAIKLREERVKFAGKELVVRELSTAAKLSSGKGEEDNFYHLFIACVYEEDGETLALNAESIPALKAGSRNKLAPLILAVTRVNGLDVEAEAKNSEAAPV